MPRRAASKIQAAQAIPDRLYFKIGEVAQIVGVEPYVLRYWETEFPDMAPAKRRGQRRYKKTEVENLLQVRHLLYERKFTIEGAKTYLKDFQASKLPASRPAAKQISLDLQTSSASESFKNELSIKLKELEAIFD